MILLLGGNASFKWFPWLGLAFQSASVLCLVSGVGIFLSSLMYMKENMSPFAVPTSEQLVKEGPYEFMRHPIYGGLILSAFALAFLTGSVERMLFSVILSFLLV